MTAMDKGTLILLCVTLLFVIIGLIVFLLLTKKTDKKNEKLEAENENSLKIKNGMPYDDIKKFLPFEDIRNNMIIQEKGERFTMMVECEGINYYLMSEAEKISVEEGFIQFLNSIRFPIQIYIQSRTINLDDSIDAYNKQFDKYNTEFNKLLDTFQALDSQNAPDERLLEVGLELEKKERIVDYTKDLIDNISYMTQNSNVLQKKYYIAVSYHISEMGLINNFDPAEMINIAYTELYNRAESVRGGIYSCGIESHILTTEELTEVMYIAVNRDDADIFNIRKVMDSDISALSTTARDVMFKKQDLVKEERRARELQEEQERQIRLEYEREKELKERNSYKTKGVDSSTLL